ncbi:hypothetical protein AVEN_182077-1, partial [Araneus ventricosus]
ALPGGAAYSVIVKTMSDICGSEMDALVEELPSYEESIASKEYEFHSS